MLRHRIRIRPPVLPLQVRFPGVFSPINYGTEGLVVRSCWHRSYVG